MKDCVIWGLLIGGLLIIGDLRIGLGVLMIGFASVLTISTRKCENE